MCHLSFVLRLSQVSVMGCGGMCFLSVYGGGKGVVCYLGGGGLKILLFRKAFQVNVPLMEGEDGVVMFIKGGVMFMEGGVVMFMEEGGGVAARGPAGVEVDASLLDDPREHRLQRQDARSRKTFKIKRQKSKPVVRRFMSHRRRPDLVTDAEKVTAEGSPSRTAVVFHDRVGFQLHRPGGISSVSRSVETIPESVEAKVHPSAARL